MSAFWRMGMQPQQARDEEKRLRVGETAIQSQKVADEFANPDITLRKKMHEPRCVAGPMHGYAIADLKQTLAGTPSTFAAAEYYNEKAKARRDELMEKYKDEQ